MLQAVCEPRSDDGDVITFLQLQLFLAAKGEACEHADQNENQMIPHTRTSFLQPIYVKKHNLHNRAWIRYAHPRFNGRSYRIKITTINTKSQIIPKQYTIHSCR